MYKLDCHQLLDECCNGSIRVTQNSVHLHQSIHTEFYLYKYEDPLFIFIYCIVVYSYKRASPYYSCDLHCTPQRWQGQYTFSLHQLQFHTHSPSFFLFLFPFLLQRAILSNAAPSNKSVIPLIKIALSYSALFLFYPTDCVLCINHVISFYDFLLK